MAIKPIPKNLLIHSIEYKEFIGSDGWDGEYATPITIQNVRVEPSTNLNRNADAISQNASHVVYVDATHSNPFPNFVAESKVIFDGVEYEIGAVKPQYAYKLHHMELELR